jgi:hypothetical protein
MRPTLSNDLRRFMAKVERSEDGCWLWCASVTNRGYGRFRTKAQGEVFAHRFSYEIHVGPIPEGLHLDHLCRVRRCVNPEHLEPVTCRENLLRGDTLTAANAAKTHCPKNHPYDETNTYMNAGSRRCRTCKRDRQREHARIHGARGGAAFYKAKKSSTESTNNNHTGGNHR